VSHIVLTGDCTTTTAVALAAAWPTSDDLLLLEFDPRGGSLAAWLDVPLTPSLSTFVAAEHGRAAEPTSGADDNGLVRTTPTGVRFVPAPFRSREAARAIVEARHSVVTRLRGLGDVLLVDAGAPLPGLPMGEVLAGADATVVVHRQDASSPGAAAVRLERLREHVAAVTGECAEVIVAVIGSDPFDVPQIEEHVDPNVTWIELANDPLAAAAHAGREGVSERRMNRLPLSRSARRLADLLRSRLVDSTPSPDPLSGLVR
jgi:MinD-like ATPase involved in chromosome partitioning or flagellar assembly